MSGSSPRRAARQHAGEFGHHLARSARSSRSTISRHACRSGNWLHVLPGRAYSLRGNIASRSTQRANAPGLRFSGQHVAPVDAPRRAAGVQPLALEDLHPAQPGIQVGAVQPHLQALAGQARGHAVEHALGAEHAELADPGVDLLEVGGAPCRQWLQVTRSASQARVQRALSRHRLGHELLVGRQVVELAAATQQQALVQAALQLPWRDSMAPFSWLTPVLLRVGRMP